MYPSRVPRLPLSAALFRGPLRLPVSRRRLTIRSQKGFGESKPGGTPSEKTTVSYSQLKKAGVLNTQKGWTPVATTSVFGERATCPVITSNGITLVLYRLSGEIFCSDANSTAYRYPMNDARIFEGPEGPAAECPFDGTTYDLRTGKVLEWCPRNNPVRAILGTLKSREDPKPLSVYPVAIAEDGAIFAKLF